MKLLGRILLGIGILVFGFVIYNMQSGFRSTDKKTLKYFKKNNVNAKIRTLPFQDGQLHWVETGGDSLPKDAPLVLFVHGAPGSARDFFSYQKDSLLLEQALMVSRSVHGYQIGRAHV